MKILIVDDESLARERLTRLLKDLPNHDLLEPCAENGYQALELTEQLKPDVVLLDINMPDLDGLQVAAQLCELSDAPAVIFCTAQDEYALQAFAVSAVGYLVKPISLKELQVALDQAQRLTRQQLASLARAPARVNAQRTHLTARSHKGLELIPIDDVIYCVADHKYVTVRHLQGETLLDESLKSLEGEFAERFVRIHRNALVSRHYIERLQRCPSGSYKLYMHDLDEALVISRRNVATIRKLIETL
ncbi:MAG TPA: LytTR family DNA-binding domain-containing protein [Thiopseudomonas sp.]|nr:LytTR family DNA-binding domain-containing protein [Thiopseudomonas sp.]